MTAEDNAARRAGIVEHMSGAVVEGSEAAKGPHHSTSGYIGMESAYRTRWIDRMTAAATGEEATSADCDRTSDVQ
jgi:hypothetical protein